MPEPEDATESRDDVAAVTSAVLTATRLLVAISVRSLAATGERVTLRQFRLLLLLAGHGETKLITLAEDLDVNPSTALRMVDRLVRRGFVSRRVNPASRREVLLQLTGSGQRVVAEVTARRRAEIAAVVARLSPRNRSGLVTSLRAFAAAGEIPSWEQERDLVHLGWE